MLDNSQKEAGASQQETTLLRKAVETMIPPERLKALTETAQNLIGLPGQALEALRSKIEAQQIVAENMKAANMAAELVTRKVFDNPGVHMSISEGRTGGWDVHCSSRPTEANNNNRDYFSGVLHYGPHSPENPYSSAPSIGELQKKGHLDHIEMHRQVKSPGEPTQETRMILSNDGTGRQQKWKVEEASEGVNESKSVRETGYFKSNGPFMDKALGREFSTRMVNRDVYTPQRHAQKPAEVQAMAQQVMAKI